MVIDKKIRRNRKKKAIRKKIKGTAEKPRLSVFKSCKNIYVQIIDDQKQVTLCSASTKDKDLGLSSEGRCNIENAKAVGKLLGQRAKQQKISTVVFDRNGYPYHGRIKFLADACRDEGLSF